MSLEKKPLVKKKRQSFRRLSVGNRQNNQYEILDCHKITSINKNDTTKNKGPVVGSDICRGHSKYTHGKYDDVQYTLEMRKIIENLQVNIRHGDEKSRATLNSMIIYQAYKCEYPRLAYQFMKHPEKNAHMLEIGMFPDIYVLCLRAMCIHLASTDDLLNFMRSSVKFFVNPKRIQKKSGWSAVDSNGIITLLKCCMPSLLSLFPILSSKDVHFWARVHIFRLFRKLLDGTQKERCTFFDKNRALLRTCIVEYMLYFFKFVTPLPNTSTLQNFDFGLLYTNHFNVGQQLRVDITTNYISKFEHNEENVSIEEISEVLFDMNARCQVIKYL